MGHSPPRARRYFQKVFLDLGPGVCGQCYFYSLYPSATLSRTRQSGSFFWCEEVRQAGTLGPWSSVHSLRSHMRRQSVGSQAQA